MGKLKVRCWWHLALGAILPWLPLGINLGGVILFCAYQHLQYRFLTRREKIVWKDDSYLDIFETAVAYIISAVVMMIMKYEGLVI